MSGTETIDPRNVGLDMWSDEAILDALIDGQRRAVCGGGDGARPALAAGRVGDRRARRRRAGASSMPARAPPG